MTDPIRARLEERASRSLKLEGWDDSRALGDALRAVLDMHHDAGLLARRYCEPCAKPWPCATARVIAEALGVQLD